MSLSPYAPVWRPLKPSVLGNRVFGFSPKLKRPIEVSSRLEHERWLLLEWDGDVVEFSTQPALAVAFVDGKMRRSRLDFWVRCQNGRERFEEIKYEQELKNRTSRAHRQIEIQQIWCTEQKIEHAVVTDAEIWSNPTLINSLNTLFVEYNPRFLINKGAALQISDEMEASIEKKPGRAIYEIIRDFHGAASLDIIRLSLFELIRCRRVDANIAVERLSPRSKINVMGEL